MIEGRHRKGRQVSRGRIPKGACGLSCGERVVVQCRLGVVEVRHVVLNCLGCWLVLVGVGVMASGNGYVVLDVVMRVVWKVIVRVCVCC